MGCLILSILRLVGFELGNHGMYAQLDHPAESEANMASTKPQSLHGLLVLQNTDALSATDKSNINVA